MGTATLGRARNTVAKATTLNLGTPLPPVPGVDETVGVAVATPTNPDPVPEEVMPDERQSVGVPAVRNHNTAVAVPEDRDESCYSGDWSSRDSATPWLAVLGPKSPLALDPKFRDHLGAFIYDKDDILGPTIKVIVVGQQKYYKEVVPFNSPTPGRRFRLAEDVRAAELDPTSRDSVKEEVDVQLLVKATTDEQGDRCAVFNEAGEGFYPAQVTARSWSVGTFIKPVRTDYERGWTKGDTKKGYYELTTYKQNTDNKGNYTFCIRAKAAGKLTPEFYEQVKALLS